ncbi:MAG: SBBP repeat-containing protein [Verrucomicrobiota bacterium]
MKRILETSLAIGLGLIGITVQAAFNFGSLPLCFEANRSQDGAASFIAHGQDSVFLLSATGAQFVLKRSSGETATAQMQLVGANPAAQISGQQELPGKVNHLVGNKPSQWQSDVSTFGQIRIDAVYPGVNVVYYGNGRQLEYDFNLAAGVDPRTIAMRFVGAKKISVNNCGELVVSLNGGEIIQHQPVIYQTIGGERHEISGGYKILNGHTVAFEVGSYDHSQPLVIDPVLSYCTYFGNNHGAISRAIALDTNGCIYIAGETLSTIFSNAPTGGFQTNFHGGTINGDAFVAKFNPASSNLVYFTYLGGSADDRANGLAVDDSGNAYITGGTASRDFPTNNALFGYKPGQYPLETFVTELNTNGSQLVFSTYLGGGGPDAGYAIAVDAGHNSYIAGYTCSTNLTVTNAYALRKTLQCNNSFYFNANAFVAEISSNGTSLIYSSYLGGTNYDFATGIAVDTSNYVYVTGYTASTNFPTTNALPNLGVLNGSSNANSAYDAFVTKFTPGFAGLTYSTFLGGINNDMATHIACDNAGNAYVTGWTISPNFPGINTNDSFSAANIIANSLTNTLVPNTTNAFLTEIGFNGTNAIFMHSAVFGGNISTVGNGVALDANGNIFVVGTTASTNFPVTTNLSGFLSQTNSGGSDVFITVFTNDWSKLIYSAYVGGIANDTGNAIAVDTAGNAFITGQTLSTNFARSATYSSAINAFLVEILPDSVPQLLLTPHTIIASFASKAVSGTLIPPITPGLLLKWQKTPSLYVLESTTNPLFADGWHTISQTPQFTNHEYILNISPTNQNLFFRLHKQQ